MLGALFLCAAAQGSAADSINCTLSGYKAAPDMTATKTGDALTVTWIGDKNQELRLRFTINGGTPTIRELAVRHRGASWAALASDVTPEFRVVTGQRRLDGESVAGLKWAGIVNGVKDLTPALIDEWKWNAFWDAPLDVPGGKADSTRTVGLPRSADEIERATATYQARGCEVKTNGTRLSVTFPGVTLGQFSGDLQFTVFKGSNLIEQEVIATTDRDGVAYLYNAGLKGLTIGSGTRIVWRDPNNNRQVFALAGPKSEAVEVPVTTANRLLIAERDKTGSIAVFPPPHTFFWTRESFRNLGYNWYRKDGDTTFSLGIRQSEQEGVEAYKGNYPLYNARPGTMQHMPMFIYVSADGADVTREAVLAYTHGDHYVPIPGYKVMTSHSHTNFGPRLYAAGNPDAEIPDVAVMRALGINIATVADRVGTIGAGPSNTDPTEILKVRQMQIEGARRHSDENFLLWPTHEVQPPPMLGHTDYFYSHPVYWLPGRGESQPLVEDMAPFGKVYHIGSVADLKEMADRENIIMQMPHPNTKGNAGFPEAFTKKPDSFALFKDARYAIFGLRWGMGIDRSEQQWSERRALSVLDEWNNRLADEPGPPKRLGAISEVQEQNFGDETYGHAPITYVKLAAVPTVDDTSPLIKALMDGDSFVSSGEILMPFYAVQGTGNAREVIADLEWTFPLDYVEVVWGDGKRTDRQILATTDMPQFGRHRFEIPFDATGKKWVRFTAWDVAGNGVLSQPIKLTAARASAQ
jgi:hypothetical protein